MAVNLVGLVTCYPSPGFHPSGQIVALLLSSAVSYLGFTIFGYWRRLWFQTYSEARELGVSIVEGSLTVGIEPLAITHQCLLSLTNCELVVLGSISYTIWLREFVLKSFATLKLAIFARWDSH